MERRLLVRNCLSIRALPFIPHPMSRPPLLMSVCLDLEMRAFPVRSA